MNEIDQTIETKISGEGESEVTDENAVAETPSVKNKSGIIVAVVVGILAIAGGIIAAIFLLSRPQVIETGNARITTNIVHISSLAAGRLERFTIQEGMRVQKGEVLGWVQSGSAMRSPVNGIVLHVFAEIGQEIAPGEVLAMIADTDKIHIQANIYETEIYKIKAGQTARVTIDVFGNRNFTGLVRNVKRASEIELAGFPVMINTGGSFRRITHTIPVEIVITDDVDLSNFLGTSARVNIYVDAPHNNIENIATENNVINNIITVEGIVESAERRTIFSNSGFMIRSVYVEAGDRVTQGQVLAVLDADDGMLNTALTQAENAYRNTRIELETREAAHESLRSLFDIGGVSRQDFRQSEDALSFARNNYNIARSGLDAAAHSLGRLSIRSPISGVVTAVNAREGAVGLGLLFVVEDTENLIVKTRFREYDINRLKTGMEAAINPIAANDVYSGIISRIHPAAVKNEFGETNIFPAIEFEAEIVVTAPETNLRIGMTALVTIDLE